MKRDLTSVVSAAALAVAALCTATPVSAYEEQLAVGASLGYAHAVSDGSPEHGGSVGVDASVGLDDIWTVQAGFRYALHPDAQPLSVFLVDAELLYLIDVFEWVPYVGVGVDGIGTLRSALFGIDFGAHPVLGLDFLPVRGLVLGFAVRPIFLLTALDRDPVYLSLSVSGALLFDL